LSQQIHGCHHRTRRSIAILHGEVLPESLLNGIEGLGTGEPLNRGDLRAIRLCCQEQTTFDRAVLEQNGTGSALSGTTTILGACQAQPVPQQVHQQ
jgi:hypothetical protein